MKIQMRISLQRWSALTFCAAVLGVLTCCPPSTWSQCKPCWLLTSWPSHPRRKWYKPQQVQPSTARSSYASCWWRRVCPGAAVTCHIGACSSPTDCLVKEKVEEVWQETSTLEMNLVVILRSWSWEENSCGVDVDYYSQLEWDVAWLERLKTLTAVS